MATPVLEPPPDFAAFELAEWVETLLVLEDLPAISRTAVAQRFAAGQAPDAAELDELFHEIGRRADTAPAGYPFRAREELIRVVPEIDGTAYRFLLILSLAGAPYRREHRYNEINPSLELLTREAMLGYLGPGAEALRFGWPNGDGRPEGLADAVEWLAERMSLQVGIVRREVDDNDKDGGIDVAAWHGFADRGPSFASFLIQVTTQATYERKTGDVVPEKWIAWIGFGQEPVRALSVPFAIPTDAKVRTDLRYTVGLLLDRLRLVEMLERRNISPFQEHAFMRHWTACEVSKVQAALQQPDTRPRMAKRRRPLMVPSRKPPDPPSGRQ